jgi:hypothetical protein
MQEKTAWTLNVKEQCYYAGSAPAKPGKRVRDALSGSQMLLAWALPALAAGKGEDSDDCWSLEVVGM